MENTFSVFFYTPKNFTPTIRSAFEDAIQKLKTEYPDFSSNLKHAEAGANLGKAAMYADEALDTDIPAKAHELLQLVGIFNYKSGMYLNTGALNIELAERNLAKGGRLGNVDELPDHIREELDRITADKPAIVKRAMFNPVFDIGQLSNKEKSELNKYVKNGILSKGKGGPYPALKTGYALVGFDFENDRKQQVDEMLNILERLEPGKITRFEKGGKISDETIYIPNRDVYDVHAFLNGELRTFLGKDVVSGVHIKKKKVKASGKTHDLSWFKEAPPRFSNSSVKDARVGEITQARIDKLKAAGLDDENIKAAFWGYAAINPNIKADTEFDGYVTGLLSYKEEVIDEKISDMAATLSDGYYEVGLKYPDFKNWKKVFKKYGISLTPKPLVTERIWKEKKDAEYQFALFTGGGFAITTLAGIKRFDEDGKLRDGEFEDVSKAEMTHGYWAVVSKDLKKLQGFLKEMFGREDNYCKAIDYLENGLGGADAGDLKKEGVEFKCGGMMEDGGQIGKGKNGYIAFYKGKKAEVYADSSYQAQQTAAAYFKAKKSYDVTVVLAEKEGEQVTHVPDFAKGGGLPEEITRNELEEELNELGIPEDDKESNGGRIPDNADYGTWLRRNDKIAFNQYYNERTQYGKGGVIKNQYSGKTDERVWNEWTVKQRQHFIDDHYHEKTRAYKVFIREYKKAPSSFINESFNNLPSQLRTFIRIHISRGQYTKGGAIHNIAQGTKVTIDATRLNTLISQTKDKHKLSNLKEIGKVSDKIGEYLGQFKDPHDGKLKALVGFPGKNTLSVPMVLIQEMSLKKGGTVKKSKKTTFAKKVKAISKNLEGKPVAKKYKGRYGSRYSKKEAVQAAMNIAGAMRKKEKQ